MTPVVLLFLEMSLGKFIFCFLLQVDDMKPPVFF